MKYEGSIIVLSEGNVVYERALDTDEIIATLLAAHPVENRTLSPSGGVAAAYTVKETVNVTPPPHEPARRGPKPKVDKPAKGTRTCKACGKPGHLAKTCPEGGAKPFAPQDEGEPITEEQFDEVKADKEMNKPSMVIASRLKIPLLEVNRAFSAPDYDWYVEHR